MTNKEIKEKTIALYDQLPQDEEGRKARTDIRDQVIDLNYSFFGYVATHTFINNTSITYEDKLQSALCHFCECWWWYRWAERYRTDLSFAVFFKLRIGEMIERELNEVKYSIRRSLCMEVGEQIGKHWGQVKYEDLSDPKLKLSVDKMNSLKAIFGTLYFADLDDHVNFLEAPKEYSSVVFNMDDKYNSIEELLIREMIDAESKLDDKKLLEISDMYGINFGTLKAKLIIAEKILYKRLKDNVDLNETL